MTTRIAESPHEAPAATHRRWCEQTSPCTAAGDYPEHISQETSFSRAVQRRHSDLVAASLG